MASEERKIQTAVIKALRASESVAWCYVTSTGVYRSVGTSIKLRIGLNGMPDILGQLKDGRLFGIEVKQPGKTPKPEQLEFLENIRLNNGVSGWCDSVESALQIIGE